ncbi:phosphopyruvate hydratase [Patescibacteria group bacterium]|nr:phosphopyruvate hydratase [Patescibacteria group bacterium]
MTQSAKIKEIHAREILDSRGNPTIEVNVVTTDGNIGVADVPSGASTGTYEALELRDNNPDRYVGKGVLKAVENVNDKLAPALKDFALGKQGSLDKKMIEIDATENKAKLGANAILGVSLAYARASASSAGIPLYEYLRTLTKIKGEFILPLPMMNIINGGEHADNDLSVQEFMIVPNAETFRERVRMGAEIFHSLKVVLKNRNLSVMVGDEGGFAPKVQAHTEAMDLIMMAVSKTNYETEKNVSFALDSAASEFYNSSANKYLLQPEQQSMTAEEMINMYADWQANYPIISIEDGLAEDDWDGWQLMTKKLKDKMMLVGDDLYVTNLSRFQKGIDKGIANSILIKLNQIGTLTETLDCINLAKENGYKTVISHRSGETGDTFIADLSVAVNSEYIKTGSLSRGERIVKYNRLMEIENEINN